MLDIDQINNVMALYGRWYKGMFICERDMAVCPSNKAPKELTYGNFSGNALWKQTEFTNSSYYDVPGTRISPWAVHIRGFHILTMFEDIMHNLHLGILRDLEASVMVAIAVIYGCENLDANLRLMYVDFRQWAKSHKLSYARRRFTEKLVGVTDAGGYPCMSSFVKAATIKVILAFLADKTWNDSSSEEARVRSTCVWAVANFLHILDTSEFWLTSAQAHEAAHSARTFLLLYQKLAVSALESGLCLYKVRPKHHYFEHTGDDVERSHMNPAYFHCFMAEDYIGRNARLASKTHRWTVSLRTLERNMIVLRQRWKAKL